MSNKDERETTQDEWLARKDPERDVERGGDEWGRRDATGRARGGRVDASSRTLNDVMVTEVVEGRGLALAGRAVSGPDEAQS
jgi:hypothetical protein